MQKTVARRTKIQAYPILLAAAVLSLISATTAQVTVQAPSKTTTNERTSDRIPCLPNNVIPAGHTSCVGPDGRTWVAPPPARGAANSNVHIGLPPGTSSGASPIVASPPNGNTSGGAGTTGSSSSVWWTVGGVGAIAALLAGLAALINAVRRK